MVTNNHYGILVAFTQTDRFCDIVNKYRIAGKFGGDFNLAVWRIVRTSPNLNPR